MKSININRGARVYLADWQEAFCLCRGNQFGIRGEFHDDEAQEAAKLHGMGASPMQAAIDMYGPRGKWAHMRQGTYSGLMLPSEKPQ